MLYVLVDKYKIYPDVYDKYDFDTRFKIETYNDNDYEKEELGRYRVKEYRDSMAVVLGGYPYPDTEATKPVPYWTSPNGKCYENLEDAQKELKRLRNDKRYCWNREE